MENPTMRRVSGIAYWDQGSVSEAPDVVKVPFNGHVYTFRLDTRQPHPMFLKVIEAIRNPPAESYQFSGTTETKRRRRL